MESTVVARSRPSWVRWEGSGRTPDPRLVFDGVEDLIDRYSEWDEVEFCFVFLAGFDSAP